MHQFVEYGSRILCVILSNVLHFVEYYNNKSLCCRISPVPGGFLFFRNLACCSWFVVVVAVVVVVVVVAVHVILSGTGWTLRVFPIM